MISQTLKKPKLEAVKWILEMENENPSNPKPEEKNVN
jgi:hypothetical protein